MEETEKNKKYHTAFVMYAQDGLTNETIQLHCTHKYLGEQDINTMGTVFRICDKFFKTTRWAFPRAKFNERVEWHVGVKSDMTANMVSVLKSEIHKDSFFPELRAQLDQFREDDYPEYIPHITVANYPSVTGMFQAYAIMTGESLVTYWRNPQWDAQEKSFKKKTKFQLRNVKNERNRNPSMD